MLARALGASRARPGARRVVEAFLAASGEGDFEALLAVLDSEVVFRADGGADLAPGALEITGAADVARTVLARGRPFAPFARAAVVDRHARVVVLVDGRLRSVVKLTVAHGRVVGMDLTLDPEKLRRLRLWAPG